MQKLCNTLTAQFAYNGKAIGSNRLKVIACGNTMASQQGRKPAFLSFCINNNQQILTSLYVVTNTQFLNFIY